jgi:hypothetical protein
MEKTSRIPKTKDKLEDFTFEDDKLDRESIAKNFNDIFENMEGSMTLSLNSSWGTGKSAFLHMWKNQLEISHDVIYINLWEEDFFKEPFLSLMNSLTNKFDDIKDTGIEIAKKIGKTILEKKTGIKIDEFFGENSKYSDLNKEKEKLKNLISDKVQDKGFPLVIMIDELDRCNPLYAIEFLETIKHFFEIDKVVFILGLDINELKHSIKKVFGNDLDTDKYLKKLIDVNYNLPQPNMEKFIDIQLSKYNFNEFGEMSHFRNILLENSTSLRDIEKYFMKYNLIFPKLTPSLRSFNNSSEKYFLENFLLIMETFDNKLYQKIKNKTLSKDEFHKIFIFYRKSNSRGIQQQIFSLFMFILKTQNNYTSDSDILLYLKENYILTESENSELTDFPFLNVGDIYTKIDFLGGIN